MCWMPSPLNVIRYSSIWPLSLDFSSFSGIRIRPSGAVIAFENTAQTAGVFLTPGIGNDFAGTASFSSGGIIDLATVLPSTPLDFFLDADGVLRIELFESFDDDFGTGAIDAIYGNGSQVQVQYVIPAPGALALLGVAGLAGARRRRG